MHRSEQIFAFFVLFAFGNGVIAHLSPLFFEMTRHTTDALLLGVNGWLFFLIWRRGGDQRLWIWGALTFLCTFFIEAVGVATGVIFGEYRYGATMRLQALNVPVVIALNWTILILATNFLASLFLRRPLLIAAAAGLLIAAYDYLIEPVAIRLDYWRWAEETVPVRNYLTWMLIGFCFSLPLQYLKIEYRHPLLAIYLFTQLVFFLALNLFLPA
jgi:uncharacterized membrane protein